MGIGKVELQPVRVLPVVQGGFAERRVAEPEVGGSEAQVLCQQEAHPRTACDEAESMSIEQEPLGPPAFVVGQQFLGGRERIRRQGERDPPDMDLSGRQLGKGPSLAPDFR
jgi:hypothetical protein